MLPTLNIEDGHKVLEIGTGSGYNAALLCHRLGDSQIFTVDVDAGVVQRASDRLHQLGYHPRVVAGDGLEGLVECSPYDRLIATVGVPRMPTRWIDQVRKDGQILFPVDLRNCGGLLPLLTVRGDTAEGHFLPAYGGFMPVRSAGIGRDAASEAFRVTADDEGAATNHPCCHGRHRRSHRTSSGVLPRSADRGYRLDELHPGLGPAHPDLARRRLPGPGRAT